MSRRHDSPKHLRLLALDAFREAASQRLGSNATVGKLRKLGEGVSRMSWATEVTAADGTEHEWVAQVPRSDATPADWARFAHELDLLSALAERQLPFRVPRPIATVDVDATPVSITTFCYGATVDMKGRFVGPGCGAEVIGELAAAVHAVTPEGLPLRKTHPTRRADSLQALGPLHEVDAPFRDDLIAWCMEHLPPEDEPATFVHGDLLGQNVLFHLELGTGLVDWEFAGTGDPAGDLAVVTRGQRKVFGTEDGKQRLVDAYNEHAERPVTMDEVLVRELALVAGEVLWNVREYPWSAEQWVRRLRGVWGRG